MPVFFRFFRMGVSREAVTVDLYFLADGIEKGAPVAGETGDSDVVRDLEITRSCPRKPDPEKAAAR